MSRYSRILVTGANGFVGRHLLAQLRTSFPTAELIAAVQSENGQMPPGADRTVAFSLEAASQVDFISELKPDGLIHLAAQASVAASFADPWSIWQTNLMGTVGLADAVLKYSPDCRFVFASSAEIYGLSFQLGQPLDEMAVLSPANPYAASKAACDLAIGEMALRGLDAVRLRAFNHTGPGQSKNFVLPSFARQIARMEKGLQEPLMRVGSLDRWRDFLDVRDVCAAYIAALLAVPTPSAVYNIASGKPRKIGDILNALLQMSTVDPKVEVEALRLRPTDVESVIGDASRAATALQWRPAVQWKDTLADVLSDWRSRTAAAETE